MMRVSARDLHVCTDQLGDGSPAALLIASCEQRTPALSTALGSTWGLGVTTVALLPTQCRAPHTGAARRQTLHRDVIIRGVRGALQQTWTRNMCVPLPASGETRAARTPIAACRHGHPPTPLFAPVTIARTPAPCRDASTSKLPMAEPEDLSLVPAPSSL